MRLLDTMDHLIESDVTSHAFQHKNKIKVIQKIIYPTLVWRPGKTAALIRYKSLIVLASLLENTDESKFKLNQNDIQNEIENGELLKLVLQELDEDYYTDTRLLASYVLKRILSIMDDKLGDAHRRKIYEEIIKRLDDNEDKIRISICDALMSFINSMSQDYCNSNTKYLIQGKN